VASQRIHLVGEGSSSSKKCRRKYWQAKGRRKGAGPRGKTNEDLPTVFDLSLRQHLNAHRGHDFLGKKQGVRTAMAGTENMLLERPGLRSNAVTGRQASFQFGCRRKDPEKVHGLQEET